MGSTLDSILTVATGGVSDVVQGDMSYQEYTSFASTGGLNQVFDMSEDMEIGATLLSGIFVSEGLYFGAQKIKDDEGEPDAIQPGISSDVPEIDPNATRALLARQFSVEEEAKRKDSKTKKGKKSQFKINKDKTASTPGTTSGVQVDADKTVGVQL